MTPTARDWRRAYLGAAGVGAAALAAVLVLALQRGALWTAAFSGGTTAGILLATAWTVRRSLPRFAVALWGAAVVPVGLLALMSPGAGVAAVTVALCVLATRAFFGGVPAE